MQLARATDDTFCIAVLGDFLGEGSDSQQGMSARWVPQRATPDTVMRLAGLRPHFRAPHGAGEEGEEVELGSMEDFDPASLFRTMALFEPFREAREAAKTSQVETGTPADGTDLPGAGEDGNGSLLDSILDVTQPPSGPPEPGSPEELDAFVREVVRPHLVRDDGDAKTRIAAVDKAASQKISDLLHTRSFQRLEAIWRSLIFLLSRIDTTGKVRVYLVHLPRPELERDLSSNEDPIRSRLHNLLSAPQLGAPGRRWAMVLGAYQFGLDPSEINVLERVARVARAADVPWLSAVGPDSMDELGHRAENGEDLFRNPPEEWHRFTTRPEAAWMGLTFPRFLLREPYGEDRRRGKILDFREEATSRADLLWGLGPFLPAALLAQGFASEGWGLRLENHLDLGGMPLWNIQGGGGVLPTSVDVGLRPDQARQLIEGGIMPLLGFPELAGVRLGGIHSVSSSEHSLAAWWRR